MPTIEPIGITKSSFQLRLLNKWNVDEIEDYEADCPDAMGRRQQRERLTEQDQNDSGNHRIPDESIRPTYDEYTWRIPRGKGALPFSRKPPRRSDGENKPQAEQSKAAHLQGDRADRVTKGWRPAVRRGANPWNENSNRERKDRDREQVTEE